MCRRIECPECKKPSYAGCGRHVEQVLADVPREARCSCREAHGAHDAAASREKSLVRRIFGRWSG